MLLRLSAATSGEKYVSDETECFRERDWQMYEDRAKGMLIRELAAKYGVTEQFVRNMIPALAQERVRQQEAGLPPLT
jgi:Mor family transcriptional regulator